MKTKFTLTTIFFLFPVLSFANSLSLNQNATCFYLDVRIGGIMKNAGNLKSHKVYEETAIEWARAGIQKFGESTFKKAYEAVMPNIDRMSDQQLIALKDNCNILVKKLY